MTEGSDSGGGGPLDWTVDIFPGQTVEPVLDCETGTTFLDTSFASVCMCGAPM